MAVEFGAMFISLVLAHKHAIAGEERERKTEAFQEAISTLSFTVQTLAEHLVDELDGNGGSPVSADVADQAGIMTISRCECLPRARQCSPHRVSFVGITREDHQ